MTSRIYDSTEISELRQYLGLSQREFAVRVGVDSGTVSRWERDEQQPSGIGLRKALDALLAQCPPQPRPTRRAQ